MLLSCRMLETFTRTTKRIGDKGMIRERAKFALELLEENEWINVKDDLPCNHEELMRSSFFTRTVLALSDEIELEFAYMHKTVTDEWKWASIRNVKYWMPIPTLPEE